MHYSQVIWVRLGQVIRQYLKSVSQEHIPRVEISQLNVIYNVPQPSLQLYIRDKLTRNMLLILTQEIKSNIIYMGEAGDQFTKADLIDSTMRGLHAYFQYIGLAQFGKAMLVLQMLKELNLELP
jgi:hypothetical protein